MSNLVKERDERRDLGFDFTTILCCCGVLFTYVAKKEGFI